MEGHQRVGVVAMVHKDIGHECEVFEFDIKPDGTIRGHGVVSYWFNVSVPVNLIVTYAHLSAHLENKIKKIKLTIDGEVRNGKVFIESKTQEKLPLLYSDGKRVSQGAWNVFSGNPARLSKENERMSMGWNGVIKGLGMNLEWKAIKEGLVIYEVKTPSPNDSFISTDALVFRGRVEGSSSLSEKIVWKSEDGRVDKVDSGSLNPEELKDSPDYPKMPPLKPNPPAVSLGREGRLSYKVTASVDQGDTKEEASVLIQQDKLDQARQEYVDMKKKQVPAREEFTQESGIYNTGDYTWSIVNPRMIAGYQTISKNYAPHPARINSAYRNPSRNTRIGGAKESRHIYGDAVDIQTVAIGHIGPPTRADWEKLEKIAEERHPSYIEKYEESGAGHVHVDWR